MADSGTFFVDEDSAAGGNGTTKSTTGPNRAYHDFMECLADHSPDPATAGAAFIMEYSGTAEITVRITNFSDVVGTSDTGRVILRSDDGTLKSWVNTVAFTALLTLDEAYVTFQDFDCRMNQASGGSNIVYASLGAEPASSKAIIENCLFHDSDERGIWHYGGTLHLGNCAIYDCGMNGVQTDWGSNANKLHARYVTVHGCTGDGFESNGNTHTLINCYSGANTVDDYSISGTKTNCASSDTTGSSGLHNIAASTSSGAYFDNVTDGSEDFHFDHAQSDLADAGTDVSSDSDYAVSTDAEGNTRDASTPDIGLYEIQVAAGEAFVAAWHNQGHPELQSQFQSFDAVGH